MLKRLSTWILAARPRLTIAVAVAMLLPLVNFVAPMVAVAGTLQFGSLTALPWLAAGWGLVSALSVALAPQSETMLMMVGVSGAMMLGGLVLGGILRRSGSLTLTLQIALIGILVLVLGFFAVVDEPVASGQRQFVAMVEALRGDDYVLPGVPDDPAAMALMTEQAGRFFPGLLGMWAFVGLAVVVLGGYAMWDHGCRGGRAEFGRFRDLNLGRALALVLATLALLGSLLAWMAGINAAFVLLIAFGLHGCALAHWLRQRFGWPEGSLVAFYAVLAASPLVLPIWPVAVCVFGYVDGWFNLVRVGPQRPSR